MYSMVNRGKIWIQTLKLGMARAFQQQNMEMMKVVKPFRIDDPFVVMLGIFNSLEFTEIELGSLPTEPCFA